jgi:S-adenosylmethionine synthetase
VDTYGGFACHGGGSFSGKDPTKVDRSAAYMARYIAKNIVAAGLARSCQIEIAYAIGVARPVSVFVDTQGTGSSGRLETVVRSLSECFDLRPAKIIYFLEPSAGRSITDRGIRHFGRSDIDLPWERLGFCRQTQSVL